MNFRLAEHRLVGQDLDRIFDMIADFSGPASALQKTEAITRKIDQLLTLPFQGTRHDGINPGLRAVPAGGKAMVVFSVDENRRQVFVYMISYGGMDWQTRVVSRTLD